MRFDIEGTIKFDVSLYDIEADTEQDAIEKAKELINERYGLDYLGNYHTPDDVKMDIDAFEIDEDSE